jgi:hypothetical protein
MLSRERIRDLIDAPTLPDPEVDAIRDALYALVELALDAHHRTRHGTQTPASTPEDNRACSS